MGGVGLVTLLYFAFTVLLLDSSESDREAGKLFLANTLVLFFWLYTTIAPAKTVFVAGCTSVGVQVIITGVMLYRCLLYTSPSPRDRQKSRMPSSA